MVWIALREVAARRLATGLAAAGLLTATLGFILLTSTSQTTAAVLKGDLDRAWPAPYDLLVRSPGSATPLETSQGLVRPNFLSNVSGGITDKQLAAIRAIASVQIAAPIAMVGIVMWPANVPIDLASRLDSSKPLQVFRMQITADENGGEGTVPFQHTWYEVVAPTGTIHVARIGLGFQTTLTYPGGSLTCDSPSEFQCWAPKNDCTPTSICVAPSSPQPGSIFGSPGFQAPLSMPLMIAGIDPTAEAELDRIDACVSSGSYLKSGTVAFQKQPNVPGGSAQVPVLASDSPFIGESFRISVQQATAVSLSGAPALASLPGWSPDISRTVSAETAYHSQSLAAARPGDPALTLLLRPGDVAYTSENSGHLTADPTQPNLLAFTGGYNSSLPDWQRVPDEARGTWYRPLVQAMWNNNNGTNGQTGPPTWLPVGNYSPSCLARRFGESIAGYSPPQVMTLSGKTLLPTRSPAGYLNTPPLLLTTLEGARFFADPTQFAGGLGSGYISAVRVKVAGVDKPGSVSQARLAQAAAEIKDVTQLQVDVLRGSSPEALTVNLAADPFSGQSALALQERWPVKGVTFRFLRAVSMQNLAMFVLVLLGAAVLVGETAYVSVRRRRRELGVLRAAGWSSWRVAALVELEMLIVGLGVGAVGIMLGIPIVLKLGLGATAWTVAALPLLAVTMAGIAALIPALMAARGSVVDVIRPSGSVRPSRLPFTGFGVGVRDLRSGRLGEVLLSGAAVALGAALFATVLMINAGFRGELNATVLGTYLGGHVRSFHVALAAMTLVVGVLAVAEVVTLGYIERQAEFAVLRALGWSPRMVAEVVCGQAATVGLIGGLAAAGITVSAGLVLGASVGVLALGTTGAMGSSLVGAMVAAVGPLILIYRATPAAALKGE